MLDLQPRVHFHEVELPVRIEQELDRAGADVVHRARERDRGRAEFLAQRRVDGRRGAFLDQFLVAPLHRAVALAEVDYVAVLVGEDLHLDVARALERAFQQQPSVAERMLRLGARGIERGGKLAFRSLPAACRARRRRPRP